MIKVPNILSNIRATLLNILFAYVVSLVCRIAFLLTNYDLFSDLTIGYIIYLLRVGLVFDTPAIVYSNLLIIVLFMLPLHYKENARYYMVVRWVYVILNAMSATLNLFDAVYFPFTVKRTTCDVFQEFENENATQLANIFFDQALVHWPLIIVFVCIVVALWYAYRFPRLIDRLRIGVYYVTQIPLFLLVGAICVISIRGGVSRAVRPITISNANQYVNSPQEAGVVLNTVFSLVRTIGKRPFVIPDYMSDAEAMNLYTPVHLADTTKAFRPMNVVVIIMESFGKQHIGFYNNVHNENGDDGLKSTYTPFLDSLLTQSLTFRYSYANGRKSIEGMPSVLSSIPSFVTPFFLTPASMNNLTGMARELCENKGYESAFFHGAENGSMGFEAFARSTGFERSFQRDEYKRDTNYNGDADFDGTWAIWDEEFLKFYCDRMSEMHEPFITSVFTASSHTPYVVPERYRGVFPKHEDDAQECIAYSDNALRLFFEKASHQNWFNNTLFVITADHASSFYDAFYKTPTGCYSVPIIFYAPCMKDLVGYDNEKVVNQIDIMPTVFGILNYDKPYVAFGQDILKTPASEKFAIHWVSGLDGYEIVKGDLLLRYHGEILSEVYAFRTDLYQKNNILNSAPTDIVQNMDSLKKSVVQQYMQRMLNNKLIYK